MEWLSILFALIALCILITMSVLTFTILRTKKVVTDNNVTSENHLKKLSTRVSLLGLLASIFLILALAI